MVKHAARRPAPAPWDPKAASDRRDAAGDAPAARDAFARILTRITRANGFRIGDDTIQGLRSVIWERVQATNAGSALDYLALLDDPLELAALHNAISIRETRFFRGPAQFWLLRDDVLPVLWLRRGNTTRLQLWSAGCASGEEAYSLAIVALEAAQHQVVAVSPPVEVLGTDSNAEALSAAGVGSYDNRSMANVPADARSRYFDRSGTGFRASQSLRTVTQFERSSLLDDEWPVTDGSVDVLFCQNVLRFLPQETVGATVERLCEALTPGGYLFLGRGELLPDSRASLELVQLPSASFHQKPLTGQ